MNMFNLTVVEIDLEYLLRKKKVNQKKEIK